VLPLAEHLVKHTQPGEPTVEPRAAQAKASMLVLHDLTEQPQDMVEQVVTVMLVQVWLVIVLRMEPTDNKLPLPVPVVGRLKEMLVDTERNEGNRRRQVGAVIIDLTKLLLLLTSSWYSSSSINNYQFQFRSMYKCK